MQVVILAGGLGTRLSEETTIRPKPMVEIGDRPILVHIMDIYARHGFKEFVVALGYKGEIIKDYFLNFKTMRNDVEIDLRSGVAKFEQRHELDWRLRLIDTGNDTLTGGRLRRLDPYLRDSGTFMLTYGDGVSDVNIEDLMRFHRSHGKLMTLTAIRPPARFGTMTFDGDRVREFKEKPQTGEGWINGGFFVCEPGVLDYLTDDQTVLEGAPLETLAADGQLMAYRHEGFWMCMDTLRDKHQLSQLWDTGAAPWVGAAS